MMTTDMSRRSGLGLPVLAVRASGLCAGLLLALLVGPSLLTISVISAITVGLAQQFLP